MLCTLPIYTVVFLSIWSLFLLLLPCSFSILLYSSSLLLLLLPIFIHINFWISFPFLFSPTFCTFLISLPLALSLQIFSSFCPSFLHSPYLSAGVPGNARCARPYGRQGASGTSGTNSKWIFCQKCTIHQEIDSNMTFSEHLTVCHAPSYPYKKAISLMIRNYLLTVISGILLPPALKLISSWITEWIDEIIPPDEIEWKEY